MGLHSFLLTAFFENKKIKKIKLEKVEKSC